MQDILKATFPDNVSCSPYSELCHCESSASHLISPHRLFNFNNGILKAAFMFTTLSRTHRIQFLHFLIAVNNHLDGPKMSIRLISRGISHLFNKIVHGQNLKQRLNLVESQGFAGFAHDDKQWHIASAKNVVRIFDPRRCFCAI